MLKYRDETGDFMACKQIFEETEGAYKIENEKKARLVLIELENKLHIKFNYQGISSVMMVIYLLSNPSFRDYRGELINLLIKYNVNEKTIILSFIENLNQIGIPDYIKIELENSLETLPFVKRLEFLRNGYAICTNNNEVIESYNLSMSLDNSDVVNFLKTINFKNKCHESVEFLKDYMKEYFIVTSKMNTLFDGFYYHSYFKSKDSSVVISASSNTLYKNNTFDKFFRPVELNQLDVKSYDDEVLKLDESSTDKNMCKVLRLALSKKGS